MVAENPENYISLQDATKYCDYTQEYLSLRARQGKLKAMKFGRNWVTKKEWLGEYLKKSGEYKVRVVAPKKISVVPSVKFSVKKFRPAFAVALLFILIISGVVFGKAGFKNIYQDAKEISRVVYDGLKTKTATISSVFEDFNLATAEIRERPTQVIREYFSWIGNAIKKIPQTIANLFRKETPEEPVVKIPPEQTIIPSDQTAKQIEELKTQVQQLKEATPKEIIKEVSGVTKIEPIKQITYQTIVNRIDDASLKILNVQIADLQTELTKRLYAPGGVINQQIYLTQPVASPKIYQENGDIVLQAAGSGSVILSAATGMQISGSQVVIDSTSLINPLIYIADRTRIGGDTEILGNLTSGPITASGDLTLTTGDLIISGSEIYSSGAAFFTASSTSSVLTVNQTGIGALADFQKAGSSVFYIDNNGNVGIGTTSPDKELTVNGEVAITATTTIYTNLIVGTSTPSSASFFGIPTFDLYPSGVSASPNDLVSRFKSPYSTVWFLIDPAVNNYGMIEFMSGGVRKWSIGKYYDDTFTLWSNRKPTDGDVMKIGSQGQVSFASGETTVLNPEATAAFSIIAATTTNPTFYLTNSGNVTSGNGILDIQTLGGNTVPILNINASTTDAVLKITQSSSSGAGPAAVFMNGNVGIGTSSPNKELTVFGEAVITATTTIYTNLVVGTSTPSGPDATFGAPTFDLYPSGVNVTANRLVSRFKSPYGDIWFLIDPAANNYGAIEFMSGGVRKFLLAKSSDDKHFTIESPSSSGYSIRMDVEGNTSFTSGATTPSVVPGSTAGFSIIASTTTSPTFYLANAGNVVSGNGILDIQTLGGNTVPILNINASTTEAVLKITQSSSVGAGPAAVFMNGNVGIGTTSPAYGLELMASSTNGYFGISGSTQGDVFVIDANGKVSIGTTSLAGFNNTKLVVSQTDTGTDITSYPTGIFAEAQSSVSAGASGVWGMGKTLGDKAANGIFGQSKLGASADTGDARGVAGMSVETHAGGKNIGVYGYASGGATNYSFYGDVGTLYNSGNVGIGTTSPAYGLELMASSTNGYFGVSGSTQGDVFAIDANGYVGIGTTTLGQKLTVAGNISLTGNLLALNTNQAVGSAGVRIYNGWFENLDVTNMTIASSSISGTVSQSFTINSDNATDDTEDSDLVFSRGIAAPSALLTWNSTSDRFEFNFPTYVDSSASSYFGGNVGIGTTSPGVDLHIYKVGTPILDVEGTAESWIRVKSGPNSTPGYQFISGGVFQGSISHNPIDSTLRIAYGADYRMTIANSGNIGIGTTSPATLLDVYQATDTVSIANFQNATGSALYIGEDGNVGIGTTSPALKLHVAGTISSTDTTNDNGFYITPTNGPYILLQATVQDFNATKNLIFQKYGGNVGIGTTTPLALLEVFSDNSSALGLLRVATGTTEGLYVDNSGNVGIGTTSPSALLDLFRPSSGNIFAISSTTAGDLVTIDNNGNVGIGTTNPTDKLYITAPDGGGIIINRSEMTDDKTSAISFKYGDNNAYRVAQISAIKRPGGAGDLAFSTSEDAATYTERMRILRAGNVGIGTTSPAYGLELMASTTNGYFGISSSTQGDVFVVDASGNVGIGTTSPASLLDVYQATDTASIANFQNATGSAFYIGEDGKVGIGTTNPGEKLSIEGSGTANENVLRVNNQGSYASRIWLRNYDHSAYISLSGRDVVDDLGSVQGALAGAFIMGINDTRPIQFWNTTGADKTVKMTIDTAGNVGIGTTTPSEKLTIEGTSTNSLFGVYASTSVSVFMIDANGNVGIGTTSPSSLLHLYGSAPKINLYDNNNIDQGYIALVPSDYGTKVYSNSWVTIEAPTAVQLRATATGRIGFFSGNNTENMRLGANGGLSLGNSYVGTDAGAGSMIISGNVGIGTTSPAALLDVFSDNSSASGLFRVATGTTEGLYVDNSGNVGIGTSSPAAKLDVYRGGIRISQLVGDVVPIITTSIAEGEIHVGRYDAIPSDYGSLILSAGGESTLNRKMNIVLHGYGASEDAQIRLQSGNTALMTLLYTGNVGIGTTTPSEKLTIWDNVVGGDTGVRIHNDAGAGGGGKTYLSIGSQLSSWNADKQADLEIAMTNLGYTGDYGETQGIIRAKSWLTGLNLSAEATNASIKFYTGSTSTPKMIIDTDENNGNVGIGTTSPAYGLELMASSTNGYFGVSSSTQGDVFIIDANGNVGIGTTSPRDSLHLSALGAATYVGVSVGVGRFVGREYASDVYLVSNQDVNDRYILSEAASYYRQGSGYHSWFTAPSGTAGNTVTQTERMRFSNAGGLSLGNSYVGTDAGAGNMIISGNVGIGTTSPAEKLDVIGSIVANTAERWIKMYVTNGIGTIKSNIGEMNFITGGYDFAFQDGGIESVRIKGGTGNVGIGTTSPAYGLELMASTTNGYFGISSSTQGDVFMIDASGNVGIGTTTPSALLEINGSDSSAEGGTLRLSSSHPTLQNGYTLGKIDFNYAANYSGGTGIGSYIRSIAENNGVAYALQFGTKDSGNALAERMRITNSGNVGIGTTSPGVLGSNVGPIVTIFEDDTNDFPVLELVGKGYSAGTAYGQIKFGYPTGIESARIEAVNETTDTEGKAAILFSTKNSISLTERMRIATNGLVGIGTTTPSEMLTIEGTSTNSLFGIYASTSVSTFFVDANGNVGIGTTTPLALLEVFSDSSSATGLFRVATGTTEGLYVDKSGNVGIGTTNPDVKLDVRESKSNTIGITAAAIGTMGSVGYQGALEIGQESNYFNTFGGIAMKVRTSKATNIFEIYGFQSELQNTGGAQLTDAYGFKYKEFYLGGASTLVNQYGLYIEDLTAATNNYSIYTGSAKSYFGGNVGIGTTSPAALLEVFSDNSSASGLFRVATGTTEGLYVDINGNVGIGTTSPTANLEIGTSGVANTRIRTWGETAGRYFDIYNNGGDTILSTNFGSLGVSAANFLTYNVGTGAYHAFQINAAEKVRIDSTGNVGIGTTSPSALLDLFRPSTGNIFAISSTTAGDLVTIDNSGNVGIGTTSPAAGLQIGSGTPGNSPASNGIYAVGQSEFDANVYFDGHIYAAQNMYVYGANSTMLVYGANSYIQMYDDRKLGFGGTTAGAYDTTVGYNSADDTFRIAKGTDLTTIPRIVLDTNGNVGIGTTSPAYGLELMASSTNGYFGISRSTQGDVFVVNASGNVGIGTTSPAALLEVFSDNSSASGLFRVATGTTEGLYVDITGNVGIGTADIETWSTAYTALQFPVAAIQAHKTAGVIAISDNAYYDGAYKRRTTAEAAQFIINGGTHEFRIAASSTIDSAITWTSAMYVDNTGNVGIGTAAPGFGLEVNATTTNFYPITNPTTAATAQQITIGEASNNSSYRLSLGYAYISSDYRGVVQSTGGNGYLLLNPSSGNVGIGTLSPGNKLYVTGNSGQAAILGYGVDAGSIGVYGTGVDTGVYGYNASNYGVYCYGTYCGGNVAWTPASDVRLKQNITDLSEESGLDAIMKLRPVTFHWKDANLDSRKGEQLGLIGQEVQRVFPQLVVPGAVSTTITLADGSTQVISNSLALDYSGLVVPLVKAVQELYASSSPLYYGISIASGFSTSTPFMSVDSLGNVGIGTTSPEYKLEVVGDIAAQSFVNISTAGAKKDISFLTQEEEEEILQQIASTSIATYLYNNEQDNSITKHLGLIAEESPKEILSVSGKGIDLYKMASFLFAGIKAQGREIDNLTAEVEAIKLQLNSIGQIGPEPTDSSTFIEKVRQVLSSLGFWVENGIARVQQLFAGLIQTDELKVGKPEKPAGITIYDENTGQPFCIKMKDGQMLSTAGECVAQPNPEPAPEPTPEPPLEPSDEGPAGEQAPNGAGLTGQAAPEPTPASEPTPTPEPAPVPEPEPAPSATL